MSEDVGDPVRRAVLVQEARQISEVRMAGWERKPEASLDPPLAREVITRLLSRRDWMLLNEFTDSCRPKGILDPVVDETDETSGEGLSKIGLL